ncbi:MAG: aldose 1-epimerase family protein [Anaerolineae bacterium]|nr:aldose 1-epimerase family protein [Anaerolineae bacterium]
MMLDSKFFETEALRQHSVDLRQFMDFRQSTLPNGMRIVEAYNGSGLTFTILPDRGLDIWTAHYNGIPLTWISQGSPHPPDYGQIWLRQYNGGLLTTCGLTHVGAPEADDETGEHRDFHGNYTRLRAPSVSVDVSEDMRKIMLRGTLAEAVLYGLQLRLERRYTLTLGVPEIVIEDVVTNLSDQAAPLMLLYHFNFGYPLVAAGTRLATASVHAHPGNPPAQKDPASWPEYAAATPEYESDVYYHHLKADDDGDTEVALYREDFGLSLSWSVANMPYLTQWKNTRQGIYVNGVEPGNCVPEGRNRARSQGRLQSIAAGESRQFGCRLKVLGDAEAVAHSLNRIYKLREVGKPIADCQLEDYAV